jgi:hypothetical protein
MSLRHLEKQLKHPRNRVRQQAVQKLASFPLQSSLPLLLPMLRDKTRFVRQTTAEVVDKAHWPKNPSPEFEQLWLSFWLEYMEQSKEHWEQAERALSRMALRVHQRELIERLLSHGKESRFPPLDNKAREWIKQTLLSFPAQDWLGFVLEELPQARSGKFVADLLDLIGTKRLRVTAPFLMEQLQTSNAHSTRDYIVQTLGLLGERRAIPLLLARMEEVLQWVQIDNRRPLRMLFVALGRLRAKKASPRLVELLLAEDGWWFPFLKETLIRTLVRLDTPEGSDALKSTQQGTPYSIDSLFWTSRQENEH